MRYFLILSLFIFSSCESSAKTEEVKVYNDSFGVQKIEYSGHSYILWSGFNRGAMIHDPDCQCNKRNNKEDI